MRRKNLNWLGFYFLFVVIILNFAVTRVCGGGVFKVDYKFAGMERSLSAMRAHDSVRHLQIIAGVDLPIGGTGRPDAVGWGRSTFNFFLVFILNFFSLLNLVDDGEFLIMTY